MSKWFLEVVQDYDGKYYANMLVNGKPVSGLPEYVDYNTLRDSIKLKTGVEILKRNQMKFQQNGRKGYAYLDNTQTRDDCRVTLDEIKAGFKPKFDDKPIKAILVELDNKGYYERFALTPEEFQKEFPKAYENFAPIEESNSITIRPLVHIWFEPCMVGDEKWNTFFTDMEEGLPESDIEAGNLAYVREDLFKSLKEYLPEKTTEYEKKPSLLSQIQFAAAKSTISEAPEKLSVKEIISNVVDELQRARDRIKELGEFDNVAITSDEELVTDIDKSIERLSELASLELKSKIER